MQTCIWQATPGEHLSIKGEAFEFCQIVEGVVESTEDGPPTVIDFAGDSFIMKVGL